MFFILNHAHIIFGFVGILVLFSKLKWITKTVLFTIIISVAFYFKTSILEYTNQPKARVIHQHYTSEEFIPNDLSLQPVLTREERETKTKELIDVQSKFNEILKD